LGLQI